MSPPTWKRLIRFVDDDDTERLGEPCIGTDGELEVLLLSGLLWAFELQGDGVFSTLVRGEKIHVKALKNVLRSSDVPIIRCIALNYSDALKKSGQAPPPYPAMFIKPSTSIAGHDQGIPIPKIAQDGTLDWEGEVAVVIGKTGKDIPKAECLDYIAGFCVSNDVSARDWQRHPEKAGNARQWCFSKGFDHFCPIGPMIVSPSVVGNASDLRLQTRVNGELRQDGRTSDMIFGVEDIIAFCSQGTTLERGTVILTGTPSGVAGNMEVPTYLNDGDIVEVTISGLGSVRNRMCFD